MTAEHHAHSYFVARLNTHTCLVYLEAFIDCSDNTKAERLEYIIDQTKNYKHVIASLTWENRKIVTWLPWLQALQAEVSCSLIFDSVYEDCLKDLPNANFFNFFLLRTNFELTKLKSSIRNQQWNPNTNRFLFLTGKPANLNRAFLLKKLIDAGLKDYCTWSLFVDEKSRSKVQKVLSLSDHEFQKFLDNYTRSPDKIKLSESEHYGGCPYDYTMFTNTSFRIISETQFVDRNAWITEKTWITIANHHPFILAGNIHSLKKLKSKGFKTFENYLTISNYDEIEDPLKRIDAMVINARDWLQTISKDSQAIGNDIVNNSQVYDQLVKKDMMTIEKICNDCDVILDELYQAGYFSDVVDIKWLLFYNNVKDQSWPYCLSARHLDQLPLPIRQELIDVFGFNPNDFL